MGHRSAYNHTGYALAAARRLLADLTIDWRNPGDDLAVYADQSRIALSYPR